MSSDPITWLDGGPTTPVPQIDLLAAFARRFLDPEDLGHSVCRYTRDQARVALGRPAVESKQFQRDQQIGVSPALRHQISPRKHHIHPQEQSMTHPDQAIESAIVAAGANVAPRITPSDIAANIVAEHYFTARHGVHGAVMAMEFTGREDWAPPDVIERMPEALSLLTFCILTLRNGFTVTGESACASPENFNAEIGRRIARENAVAKVWPLMGYALKQRMHEQANLCQRVTGMNGEICGLQGPCPDCGLTLHDVPEGA